MCCGSSRAVGLRPNTPILLGEENGDPPRYVRVLDGSLIPGTHSPAQIYVTGSMVDQAIVEGKLEDVSGVTTRGGKVTKFRVTLPDGRVLDFASYNTARQYAVRNGGYLSVIQEEPDA